MIDDRTPESESRRPASEIAAPQADVALPAAAPQFSSASRPASAPPESSSANLIERRSAASDAAAEQIAVAQRRNDELRAESHHAHVDLAVAAAAVAAAAIAPLTRSDEARERRHEDRSVRAEERASRSEERQPAAVETVIDASEADRFERDSLQYEELGLADDELADGQGLGDLGDAFDGYSSAGDEFAVEDTTRAMPEFESGDPGAVGSIEAPAPSGPAETGATHADATPWNGQTTIGTITYVEGDRVEQYTGRGTWTSFSISNDLHGVVPEVGAPVQIDGNGRIGRTPEQQVALQPELGRGLSLS